MNQRLLVKARGILIPALLMLVLSSCTGQEPAETLPWETFPRETFEIAENAEYTFRDGLLLTDYPTDSAVGEWLAGCSRPDRDESFGAYVLRFESEADGNTTYDYLIYYPHGGSSVTATPDILEGQGGYAVRISYAAGEGTEAYSLCRLTVTLPTGETPRLRLMVKDDALGVLSTVSNAPF